MKSKKIRILFFGIGSIGQRHAKLLMENFNVELYAYRTSKDQLKLPLRIMEFYDLEDAFSVKPDIAFLTNPTFLHVETAIECAKRGVHLFVEKPLSHSLENLSLLNKLIEQQKIYSYVAFCMRFHPVINKLKEMMINERIFYVRTINASFLPNWRSAQDYRKNFSAYSEKGGGVLLEMMHELDYNQFLFGKINSISGNFGNVSNLEVNCEDYGELHCTFNNGMIGHILLNFFSHLSERYLIIYCTSKVIRADLLDNSISEYRNGTFIRENRIHLNNINDIYLSQLRYFISNFRKKNLDVMNTVPKATELLRHLLKFKDYKKKNVV